MYTVQSAMILRKCDFLTPELLMTLHCIVSTFGVQSCAALTQVFHQYKASHTDDLSNKSPHPSHRLLSTDVCMRVIIASTYLSK